MSQLFVLQWVMNAVAIRVLVQAYFVRPSVLSLLLTVALRAVGMLWGMDYSE